MVKDARWPTSPFIFARSVQLLCSVVIISVTGYFVTWYTVWYAYYTLCIGALTFIYICINFALFYTSNLLPMAIVVSEPILLVLWIIAIGAIGNDQAYFLASGCAIAHYDDINREYFEEIVPECGLLKGAFAIVVLQMISIVPTIALASIALRKTQNELIWSEYDAQHGANMTAEVGTTMPPSTYRYGGNPQPFYNPHPSNTYYQPAAPEFQPQGYPSQLPGGLNSYPRHEYPPPHPHPHPPPHMPPQEMSVGNQG